MTTIDEIIQQQFNPFDPVTFKTGHFWQEQSPDKSQIIESIHQQELNQIDQIIKQTKRDNFTRTILLTGDKGAGKSYFLGRLKDTHNHNVFFAYIAPWMDSGYIWRHTLRYTIDSLMCTPKGKKESQLLLWLKGLATFQNQKLMNQLLGNRNLFIHNLRNAYPAGIYQARSFFGALYDLTDTEKYHTACSWFRGEDLDKEELQLLGVRQSIDTEEYARHILENFGRITNSTQPIVLCFDQVENGYPRDEQGYADLQPLMSLNTTFHNERFKNFVIIISVVLNNWREVEKKIPHSDTDRIEQELSLKSITLNQAKELWASRLSPLHRQAKPKPASPIYPLDANVLESTFPGGKVNVREALQLGRELFLEHKIGKPKSSKSVQDIPEPVKTNSEPLKKKPEPVQAKPEPIKSKLEPVKNQPEPVESKPVTPVDEVVPVQAKPVENVPAEFNLIWQKEFKTTQDYVSRIRQYSAVERLGMVRNILNLFQVERIKRNFLPSQKYQGYSLSYQQSKTSPSIGIIWTEESNMNSFCNIMKLCQKVVQNHLCDTLYLIRAERLGTPSNKGYQVYTKVFENYSHQHIIPDLASLHYLVTYTKLLNSVNSGELVIAGKTPTIEEFKTLVRQEKVLESCCLLQELGITQTPQKGEAKEANIQSVQDFIMNLMKTQQVLARLSLINMTVLQYPEVEVDKINQIIDKHCNQNKIRILNPLDSYSKQTICLVV
jgi:hypothetical protein